MYNVTSVIKAYPLRQKHKQGEQNLHYIGISSANLHRTLATMQARKKIAHKNSLLALTRFSTLFFSIKIAESGKIFLVSCMVDLDDIQV